MKGLPAMCYNGGIALLWQTRSRAGWVAEYFH